MSWKFEESTHNALFDKQKLNRIVNLKPTRSSLNSQGDKLEYTREKFKKTLKFY